MTVHLLKTAVQIKSFDALQERQSQYMVEFDGQLCVMATTRYMPKRREDVLAGGSMFWIFKRAIQCRQRIMGLEQYEDEERGTRCAIYLHPTLVRVKARSKKPIQGWRYLEVLNAPPDSNFQSGDEQPPAHLEADLRAAGLI